MTLDEYQKESRKSVVYPYAGSNPVFPALGLAGEAGEIANHVKKAIRDDNGAFSERRKGEMKEELGDAMWYIAQIATELGLSLEDIADVNLIKIRKRYQKI